MGMGFVMFFDEQDKPYLKVSKSTHDLIGTNNEAEYRAVIYALEEVVSKMNRFKAICGAISLFSDSELIIRQITGVYAVRKASHDEYLNVVLSLVQEIEKYLPITFSWVSREHPRQRIADAMSRKGNEYYKDKK